MPIHRIIHPNPQSRIAVWRVTESVETLLGMINAKDRTAKEIEHFKSEKRKQEWIAVRLLHEYLMPNSQAEIEYTEHRKPFLSDDHPSHISISHSADLVALMMHDTLEVGMDLEAVRENIQVVRKKFLSADEKAFCSIDEIEKLIVMWSAKESIYKLYGKKELTFSRNILLQEFELSKRGSINAILRVEKDLKIMVEYALIGEVYLTWCVLEEN